jgi:Zn-dependent protease
LRIAVAGPAASLALAGAFAIVAAGVDSGLGAGVLEWLARINLVLALFNLVPAFPMDGGRILRAILWHRKGRAVATRIAVTGGKGFALVLIGGGLLLISVRDPIGGAWLAFLGLFLSSAAEREEAHLRSRAPGGDDRDVTDPAADEITPPDPPR